VKAAGAVVSQSPFENEKANRAFCASFADFPGLHVPTFCFRYGNGRSIRAMTQAEGNAISPDGALGIVHKGGLAIALMLMRVKIWKG